jgi:hypothetical protein
MAGRSQSTFRDKEHEPHPHSILTALFAHSFESPVKFPLGAAQNRKVLPIRRQMPRRLGHHVITIWNRKIPGRSPTAIGWRTWESCNPQLFSLVIFTSIMAMNQ